MQDSAISAREIYDNVRSSLGPDLCRLLDQPGWSDIMVESHSYASGYVAVDTDIKRQVRCSVSENGDRDFCLWHPHLHADISYFGTEYPDFPLPRLVFRFRVSQEGKVFDCRLGVVEDKPPAEDSAMFVYPFSNVGGFHLCTGNNVLPVYKKTSALANLPGYLLQLPNNNDSFNPQNNKLHMPYRELLNHLKTKDPAYYYTDVLIPSRKTLKDFIA